MAIEKEIWVNHVLPGLYKNNEFATVATNHDMYVNGKTVHVPMAGAGAGVKVNRTTFPATASDRTDTDISYNLDSFTSDPTRVPNLAKYQLSYDLRESVLHENVANLKQVMFDHLLYKWATGITPVQTSGSAVPAEAPSATGNRKAFTKAEFVAAAKSFNQNNYHGHRKVAVLNATHFHQFLDSLSEGEKTAFHNVANMVEGQVGRYMGIDVFMRSRVLTYRYAASTYTLQDIYGSGWTANAADAQGSIFYAETAVARAKGDIDFFESERDPHYYGDVISMECIMGGKTLRTNGVFVFVDGQSA